MSHHSLKRKIDALPDAKRIPKRWRVMQAAKESRHSETRWKVNPLRYVHKTPAAIEVFRQLPDKLRHKMFRKLGEEKEFSPRHLVTYQPVVSAEAIYEFAANEELVKKKKAYVIGTEHGPCVWNGNHRCVAALLTGRKFKAIYLDLVGDGKRK